MSENSTDKRKIIRALFIPGIIGILMCLIFILENGMDWDFHRAGIFPRRIESLFGIFGYVFIHADVSHLINNLISFIILGSFLYYFYGQIATKILITSYISSGLMLWIIGREGWHIGASGLIYSLAFFLFFSGIIRKHGPLIAISFIVALNYGNMIWHIFPWEIHDSISWEGHLSGGVIGFILAITHRKSGPQKPIKVWEEEDDSIEYISDEDVDDTNVCEQCEKQNSEILG